MKYHLYCTQDLRRKMYLFNCYSKNTTPVYVNPGFHFILPFKLLLTQDNQYYMTFTLTSAVYSHYAIVRYIIKSSREYTRRFELARVGWTWGWVSNSLNGNTKWNP
jgi:hypothetical protein